MHLSKQRPKLVMKLRIISCKFDGSTHLRDRVSSLVLLAQSAGQGLVRLRLSWSHSYGSFQFRYGFISFPVQGQSLAKIQMCDREIWPQANHRPEVRNRSIRFALLQENLSQRVLRVSIRGVSSNRRLEISFSFYQIAGLPDLHTGCVVGGRSPCAMLICGRRTDRGQQQSNQRFWAEE
jgi:hypothetical protein